MYCNHFMAYADGSTGIIKKIFFFNINKMLYLMDIGKNTIAVKKFSCSAIYKGYTIIQQKYKSTWEYKISNHIHHIKTYTSMNEIFKKSTKKISSVQNVDACRELHYARSRLSPQP